MPPRTLPTKFKPALSLLKWLIVIIGSACAVYIAVTPKPLPPRQLPTAYADSRHSVSWTCVKGVRYLYEISSVPTSAVVDQYGLAMSCDQENDDLDKFGRRYRIVCSDNIQLVRFIELRHEALFTLYDNETRRPKTCTRPGEEGDRL